MAVGVLTAVPEFTKEIYDGITEKLFGHAPMREDDAPEGLTSTARARVTWESREAFQRFMDEKLGPAMGKVMGSPPPESGGPQFFPFERAGRPTLRQRIAV